MIISRLFKLLAFLFIIVFPHVGIFRVLDESKELSIFITIISLGILFLSFNIEDIKEYDQDYDDILEMMSCYESMHNQDNKINDELLTASEKTVNEINHLLEMNEQLLEDSKLKNKHIKKRKK